MWGKFILILLQFLQLNCVDLSNSGVCFPLTFDGLLTCENSKSLSTNDCRGSQPIGTIAKYSCKPHYVLRNTEADATLNYGNNELRCGENGSWIGHERFKSTVCQEECGRRLTNPKPLIVNGRPTNATTWPWHVALFRRRNSEFYYICGGTIISRSTILTVAHCVTGINGQKLLPNSTVVAIGAITSNFTENRLAIDTQIIEIKEIYVSEHYDVKKEFQADIAVLQLSKYIEYTDHVSPICLPNDFAVDTNAIRPGTMGDVVGYGVDESGHISHKLKHGGLEIKSHTECFISLDRILSESQFCAGSPTPRDDVLVTVCNGDSGGGFIRPSLVDQKYYIHGLVSTGDPRKQICEAHAVFTRVYTFIFWIRDILKETKDNVLHGGSGNAFLHRQSGTEEERAQFLSINQEWKNKVTAIELSYMDIDPEILLKSLDYSKTLQSINFTNVKFSRQFAQQRLVLPLLKSFSLDILRPDFELTLTEDGRFPISLTKDFLRSLVFFEKDVEGGSMDIARIESLKTNVDITVHIFKLLKIYHERGTIVLSQIPFANEILANISPDFELKYLGLSKTHISPSFLSSRLVRNVENLLLDEVTGIQSNELSHNLKTLTGLSEFVFILPKSESRFEVPLNSLPISLKHLALTRALLVIDEIKFQAQNRNRVPIQRHMSAILFPEDTRNINKEMQTYRRQKLRSQFNNLDTFYCDFCLPDTILNTLHSLSEIFPNLRRLVLKTDTNLNISLDMFENFKNLEYALVNLSGGLTLFRKNESNWNVISLKNFHVFLHLDFIFNRKDNFWSSEADYLVGKRVTSFENFAFKSLHYRFNGGLKEKRDFTVIPRLIQERLLSIEIVNSALSKKVLEETLKYATDVRRLRITNVSFFDIFIRELVELPNLEEYIIEHDRILPMKYFDYENVATILSNVIPNWIPFSQGKEMNLKTNLLSSQVNKYHIQYGGCVMVSWSKMDGTLTSNLAYTNEWFKHTNNSILVKKLAFQYWELDPAVVPTTISQLNLNFAIVKNIAMILHRLDVLNNLKLINVRANREGNFKGWDWIQISIEDLSKHSKTLEYLAIEKAHLRNFSPGMKFEKVEFVYLESCTFEKSFVRNFMTTFPNLKRLVILGGNDPRIQIYLDVIILGALRSKTVEWILIYSHVPGSTVNRARKEILDRIGINKNDSKYFIFERTAHSEAWKRNSSLDESKVESELQEMKGLTEIGIDPQCHAYSYLVETNPADSTDVVFKEVFQDILSTRGLRNNTKYLF